MADAAVQIFGGIDPAASAVLASLGGRYRVMAELGRGGFGQVLLAEDELLRRKVAIKILRKTRRDGPKNGFTADAAFLTEARMVARMEHAGIVPIYDVIETQEGGYCIISRYVEGRTLREHLGERRLPFLEATDVTAGLCEALSHAHKLGVAHRDVKPANIMLTAEMRPLLLDFGLARSWSELGGEGLAAGTPGYMSPEQARGEDHLINNRSDIFSLGVVLYEMLTGQQAFPCGSARQQVELLESGGPPPPRQIEPRVPKELERICLKALQPQIRMRYAMAADMLDDLRQWHAAMSETVVAKPPAVAGAGKAPVAPLPLAQATSPHSAAVRVVPRGLRAFDQGDADFFLTLVPGPRDRHGLPESLRFWKQRIESNDAETSFRVGVLYGPSGCGKSSLIRAGLLPRCAEHITVLFHEARSVDNATRLARALWQKFPSLAPFGESPPVLLQKLRHSGSLHGGRKLLIVIDQTEQWLRAGESPVVPLDVDSCGETLPNNCAVEAPDPEEGPALLNTLRQCDGTQVQMLILVRDDFWRSVSRLLADADVELDNSNSALVDLFEPRHAEKVLECFGRAYGCLPEDPATALAKTSQEFIRESVRSLKEDRRVSPVRLALFAQMFRDRDWSPDGLRQVGGVSGVAVTFLEETFRGPSARAAHRMHERAARQVLQLFVPETGDVRGSARAQAEMLAASGYEDRPKAFQELLHTLDADLRLLTPVDTLETTDGQASWQLTHDHMVPALREWLLARKADTVRGRAEIRLDERAREWQSRPDPARLPGVWEWAKLRILTRREQWTGTEKRWMRAGMRRSRVFAGWTLAACFVVFLVLHELRGREHGAEISKRILGVAPADVRRIMTEGIAWHRWTLPQLRLAAQEPSTNPRGLNARLALVDLEPRHVPQLAEVMMDADAPAFAALRDALTGRQDVPVPYFKAILQDTSAPLGRKLRAFAALAFFDPADPLAKETAADAAQWLLTAVDSPGAWAALLRSATEAVSPPLEEHLSPSLGSNQRKAAATALAALHAGSSRELIRFLRLTPPEAIPTFATELQRLPETAEQMIKAINATLPEQLESSGALTEAGEFACQGQANILLTALHLGLGDHVWPFLAYRADRTLRTFAFLNASAAGVPPDALVNRVLIEKDPGITQALLLALCSHPHSSISAAQQLRIIVWLRNAYVLNPDGGVHSAIATLLKRWSLGHELHLLNQSLPRTPEPADGMGWWVTPSSIDMRIITLPGSRRVAVSACEVTQAMLKQKDIATSSNHELNLPATGISWIEAAAFCLDLSRREKLPDEALSYQPKGDSFIPRPVRSTPLGYRMPTKEEWQAADSSAPGRWDFGKAVSVVIHFAWLAENAGDEARPVASLLPNSWGLWDTLGNAVEWTHEVENHDSKLTICPLTGLSFISVRSRLFDTTWSVADIDYRKPQAGIRLARTLESEK